MNSTIPKKVLKYEEFVNDVLKNQLKKIEMDLDRTYTEIAELVQLESIIQTVQDTALLNEGLKTKVDLGCNFYMQAFVSDPTKILINVGLNHFVEFTLSEGLVVIKKQVDFLNKRVDILKDQSAQTKAHIKLVLLGIKELQNIK